MGQEAAGIVLCGGQSRRMGRAKASLPFGPETMLARVVRLLGEATEPIVVVAAPGQALPPLPSPVRIAHDRRADRGPLEGLAAGLHAVGDLAAAAFVTGCDVPLLVPALVRRLIELSAGYDVAVPHVEGFDQPLSAVYRTTVLARAETLLAAGRLRPAFLFEQCRVRRVTVEELTAVDPELQSLANVNSPGDYAAALQRAGFPA
ncbi:MAG: molybdenum cofactor guanylyltransferase [Pirellulales bacterium]|nr:molybdenum cofactor guanylyltransferase [Pirellulales bacterium]